VEKLRKIRDEKEARRCIAAARAAGNLGQWARAHGYDGRSLHAWAMNLGRGPAAKASPRRAAHTHNANESVLALVELIPSPSPTPTGRVVVQLGDFRIELGPDFDPAALQRLLAVLRAC
jgi:hypothetical protein